MKDRLQKIFDLIRRSGEKAIVFDGKEGGDKEDRAFVVMDFTEYEKLTAKNKENKASEYLTDEELVDKINRDIALWNLRSNDDDLDEMIRDNVLAEEVGEDYDDGIEDEDMGSEENLYYYATEEDEGEVESEAEGREEESEEEGSEAAGRGWGVSSEAKEKAKTLYNINN
jgi:hypothetical protein